MRTSDDGLLGMKSDSPLFILSQDYELFFHDSGSVEKCLFEPCDALLDIAAKHESKITFFVDAGMLSCMERYANANKVIRSKLDLIKSHISSLARGGHEIALHVHPHWEDTAWVSDRWNFSKTRYQFRDFSKDETEKIFREYAGILADISGCMPTSFRAGGFCVEPFDRIGPVLSKLGILVDSSVLPGAILTDPDKGFDFRSTPENEWWTFRDSPTKQNRIGPFLELPPSVHQMPFFFYWGRMLDRIGATNLSEAFGDGLSKRIGKEEIMRRLLGASRIAELSVDDAKAAHLLRPEIIRKNPRLWHVMGHPKLLSRRSLQILEQFLSRVGSPKIETMTVVADKIRAH